MLPGFLIALLFPVTFACTSCQAGRLQPRSEGAEFSYNGLTGPVDWDQFANTCGTGKTQSPINIVLNSQTSTGDIANYADIGSAGFDLITLATRSSVSTKDKKLRWEALNIFHFHTPSEHRLNNQWYPLEVHFVHQGKTDATNLAVVGIFFNVNERNRSEPMIKRMAELLKKITKKGDSVTATDVHLRGIRRAIMHSKKYTYTGSLTTPPCTEGVAWFISTDIIDISIADLNMFKKVMQYNARDLQAGIGETNIVEYASQYLAP
ncbi:hypothetical protein H072_7401 [Dactylellina haptotyla CBS 200.50]|uniref:Carbonic anhydrase n=1 Tax=Dactylellina haptotyla (strain CBS 200.50) TaxID=1284197 RepID=S8A7Q5_DACHA|nr:hypothetical protein H072_7401 [Dactylellina haptotyla CBS 200.50]